jgi:hypothetical protein
MEETPPKPHEEDENHPSSSCCRCVPCGTILLAFAPKIFLHLLDFFSRSLLRDRRQAIFLAEPGLAASKLTSKSQSSFAKRASETRSWVDSTDGVAKAIIEAASESTSKCTTNRGGADFPHNSYNSGMNNITGV